MDTGFDAFDFRPTGGGPHRAHRCNSGSRGDVFDLVYAYRFGIRNRMENGLDSRISRRHDAAAGADVDGFRGAVPYGHGAWSNQGAHVGQSDDVFSGAAESYAAVAECRPRRGG